MSAGYRNTYSTESLGCIAIEVNQAIILTGVKFSTFSNRQREKDTLSHHLKTFWIKKKNPIDICIDQMQLDTWGTVYNLRLM